MSAVGSLHQQHKAMQVQHLTPVEVAIATCYFVVYPMTFLSVLVIPTNIPVCSEYSTETLNELSNPLVCRLHKFLEQRSGRWNIFSEPIGMTVWVSRSTACQNFAREAT